MSAAAFQLHSLSTATSAVRGRPGFVPDSYLVGLTDADLGHPSADCVFLATELCAVGVWEPVAGGYRVLDAEAVQVCADRVRELREEDARRANGLAPGLPDLARTEPAAAGAAGTTRFGGRNLRGTAASFRCAQCGDLAGAVRVARANPAASAWRLLGREPYADGLVLECFLGTSWHAEGVATLDAAQEFIEQGDVDPIAIRAISASLWEVTPFYCPECGLNYCSGHWDTYADFNIGFWDCIIGICPNGHRHLVG
jgi:predicted RNA-binding Zn-ribbon protein involved in translation (DUF1610 family)